MPRSASGARAASRIGAAKPNSTAATPRLDRRRRPSRARRPLLTPVPYDFGPYDFGRELRPYRRVIRRYDYSSRTPKTPEHRPNRSGHVRWLWIVLAVVLV